jgi:hypothetical protein
MGAAGDLGGGRWSAEHANVVKMALPMGKIIAAA